ncbi:MAG: phosphoglucosamine mutase [Alphaproteobacteria bacterium]|nr:phosphoglucosamine mutase [Alphaproteobacteria bacterium]
MSRFGTDGIRGRWPEPPLTPDTAAALGRALRARVGEAPVVIGRDTRESGPALRDALLIGMGGDVVDLGVLPTAGVSAALAQGLGAAGVVITASHNPWTDNGLKVLGPGGGKLPTAEEAALDAALDAPPTAAPPLQLREVDGAALYQDAVLACLPPGFTLRGLRVAVDAAHGAAWQTAPALLGALGAEVVALGCAPDGRNINEGVGALHPDGLAQAVPAAGCAVGIALDGDADRCVLVDGAGEILPGDGLLLLVARAPGVVGTVMCNAALERALGALGVGFERVAVGDRNVAERMAALDWPVGGEPSGHVLLAGGLPTGDGLLTALFVLGGGPDLRARLGGWRPDPQALVNARVPAKPPLASLGVDALQAAALAAGASRVLLRYSGTEPKLRVMVEAPEQALAERQARALADALTERIRTSNA